MTAKQLMEYMAREQAIRDKETNARTIEAAARAKDADSINTLSNTIKLAVERQTPEIKSISKKVDNLADKVELLAPSGELNELSQKK